MGIKKKRAEFSENAQGLQTGTHRNLIQQIKLVQKMLKHRVYYITKQGIKRFLLFLAWTHMCTHPFDNWRRSFPLYFT